MKIKIRGLEINACHGVHGFEKQTPQRFLIDADLSVDFYEAAKHDDLNKTVNYSAVCSLIAKTVTENCFNLIESLAYACAFAVMENFATVSKITLTVKKPDAPLKVKFDSVEAEAELERNTVYLSLGSSMGDRAAYLDSAVDKLKAVRGVKVEKVSEYMTTEPYGGVAKNSFLNCAAKIKTLISPEQLLLEIHRIEKECRRVRDKRWDDRTLDIDIIFFGNKTVREENLIIPHPDYANRPFVTEPLKNVEPELFLHDRNIYLKDL